jgi:hypothetical protein
MKEEAPDADKTAYALVYDQLRVALEQGTREAGKDAVAEILFQGENQLRTVALLLRGWLAMHPQTDDAFADLWALGDTIEQATKWFEGYRQAVKAQPIQRH